MNAIKNKLKQISFDRVWPFLLCIVLAFLAWLYVMYIQPTKYDHEFENVSVSVKNVPSKFADCKIELEATELNAIFRGTGMDLAKCDSGNIRAHVDLSSVSKVGLVDLPVIFEYPSGVSLECVTPVEIKVNVIAPMSDFFTDIPVVVERNGKRGDDVIEGFVVKAKPETVAAYLTSTDDGFKTIDREKIYAVADISNVDITVSGIYSPVKLHFVSEEGISLNDPNMYIEILVEKIAEGE
jgi:hypothetical protein